MPALHSLVDLGRYPIDRPGSVAYRYLLADLRRDLERDGCAVLPSFVHAAGLAILRDEVDAIAAEAAPDPTPVAGEGRLVMPGTGFAARGPLRRIHDHPAFLSFLRMSLDTHGRDPLDDGHYGLFDEGQGVPWHFDSAPFAVSLAIRTAEGGGGDFEYVPGVRGPAGENAAAIARVLAGDRRGVRVLKLRPGDLQVLRGDTVLHRVTPVALSRPRLVSVWSTAAPARDPAEALCALARQGQRPEAVLHE